MTRAKVVERDRNFESVGGVAPSDQRVAALTPSGIGGINRVVLGFAIGQFRTPGGQSFNSERIVSGWDERDGSNRAA
jgi:hypothetical protein